MPVPKPRDQGKCARRGVMIMYALRVLSLGAGVQSTALALMAAHGEFEQKPDCAIFADTGWDPRDVYEHLDRLERELPFPVYRVSAGNIRKDALASKNGKRFATMPFHVRNLDGKPAMLWRQCTREYKVTPITKKIRELLGLKPGERAAGRVKVQLWMGISLDEIQRMRDNREPWIDNHYPLIERRMTRWDCQLWLERHGYTVPRKSACIGCPFHDDATWRWMRENRPDEWREAVEFDRAIRSGLPGVLSEAYVHRSLVPLDEVDLYANVVEGQLDLFAMECEGYCGA